MKLKKLVSLNEEYSRVYLVIRDYNWYDTKNFVAEELKKYNLPILLDKKSKNSNRIDLLAKVKRGNYLLITDNEGRIKWLKEYQSNCKDSEDGGIEEAITTFEKLEY